MTGSRGILILVLMGVLGARTPTAAGDPPSAGLAANNTKDGVIHSVNLPRTKTDAARTLWIARTKARLPAAVLVLFVDGEQEAKTLLVDPAWQHFAEDYELNLAAVTAAATTVPGKVPPPASSLSPTVLVLQAIDHEYGSGMPLVLYGWSSQADFAAHLLSENPKRILSWCLRAPSRLPASRDILPAGIVVCQKENKPMYDALMQDFTTGRKKEEHLTWIALPGEQPAASSLPVLDSFVRSYFAAQFRYKAGLEQWVNIDTKQPVRSMDAGSQPAVTSYLPHPALATVWAALHVPGGPAVAQQMIVEREVDTFNKAQPKLHLYWRRPVGAGNADGKIAGVLAYCLWDADRAKIISKLQDEHNFFVRYADEHHLALLTWNTAIAFNNSESADERSQQENFQDSLGFNKLADAWERGVHALCYDAGLPENDFLLYSISAGAQWAHRLALRKPGHFLAVNIHVNSSYDWPTPAAKNILWLQTTGEREYGYQAALRFYAKCRELGYPIIFKAGENLGHNSSPQIEEITQRFFDYALGVKARRDALIARDGHLPGHKASPNDMYALSGLGQAPYYADLINQEVYGSDQKDLIPAGQRVPLPTKALAQAWGEIVDTPGLSLVSNPQTAAPTFVAPSNRTNKVGLAGSNTATNQPPAAVAPPIEDAGKPQGKSVPAIKPGSESQEGFADKQRLSVQRSLTQSPELAQAGSPLNSAFVNTYRRLKSDDSPLLHDPTWPEQILQIVCEQTAASPDFQREFQQSVQRAVTLYPALAESDSPTNAAFLTEYRHLKEAGSDLLAKPTWPEQVARTVSDKRAGQ